MRCRKRDLVPHGLEHCAGTEIGRRLALAKRDGTLPAYETDMSIADALLRLFDDDGNGFLDAAEAENLVRASCQVRAHLPRA